MPDCLTDQELIMMKEAGKVAAAILDKLRHFIRPKISTKNIEEVFEANLKKYPGMKPAFKGFMGYPASLCVSVNEEIIHGIPSARLLENGDLVSVDLGIKYNGLFVDAAYTYIVGRASALVRKLVKIALKALQVGIKNIKVGSKVGDISFSIQELVEKNGFSVIKKFVGHGIGRELHLKPEIPNFGEKGQGPELKAGYALAVEPMISMGSFEVDILQDGWTAKTKDNSLAAHFEHTVAITNRGPWILTQ